MTNQSVHPDTMTLLNHFEEHKSDFPFIHSIKSHLTHKETSIKALPTKKCLCKKTKSFSEPIDYTSPKSMHDAFSKLNAVIELEHQKRLSFLTCISQCAPKINQNDMVESLVYLDANKKLDSPAIIKLMRVMKYPTLALNQIMADAAKECLVTHNLSSSPSATLTFSANDNSVICHAEMYIQAGSYFDTKNINILLSSSPVTLFDFLINSYAIFNPSVDSLSSILTTRIVNSLDQIAATIAILTDLSDTPDDMDTHRYFTLFNLKADIKPTKFHSIMETTRDRIETTIRLYESGAELRHLFGKDWLITQYTKNRTVEREVIIYSGPTNSGKTYHSIANIKTEGNNAYLAPLRLLAMEISDKLNDEGVLCSLITGEERELVPRARVTSSTIEMANLNALYDSVIIDEAQMVSDPQRGSAWTRAILGVNTKKLILCCAPNAIEPLQKILALAGDTNINIINLTRMTTLEVDSKPIDIENITPGTAVIAFSKKGVLNIKSHIQMAGLKVSSIYGALPPEVRRKQADDFADGITDVVVATDAIGMGMNLPIERVIFAEHEKFNGEYIAELEEGLVKQIAGRAGRYLKYEKGFFGATSSSTLQFVKNQVSLDPTILPTTFFLSPSTDVIMSLSKNIGSEDFDKILAAFIRWVATDPRFVADKWETSLDVFNQIKKTLPLIPLEQRIDFIMAPCNTKEAEEVALVRMGIEAIDKHRVVGIPTFDNIQHFSLNRLENAVSLLTLYRYLHYKFPDTYPRLDEAKALITEINVFIEKRLLENTVSSCYECKKPLPIIHKHRICEFCYEERHSSGF